MIPGDGVKGSFFLKWGMAPESYGICAEVEFHCVLSVHKALVSHLQPPVDKLQSAVGGYLYISFAIVDTK